MRKTSKKTTQPTVTLDVMPLKSVYGDESVGACVSVHCTGNHAGTVERYALAAAYVAAAKIVLLDTPAAAPRVYAEDSWRNSHDRYISTARVDVECAQHTDAARYVAAVKEALDVA